MCIHIHPLGLFFTRPIMPQVKYLRGCFWFVGNCFYSQLSPWGRLCTWIVLQAWQSVPMNSLSKKKLNSTTSPQFESKPRCFHQILHMDRDVQGRKSWYSESPWNSRSNASKINEFEDPYKEIWQEHWMLRVMKFVGTDCSAGTKWT